MAFTSLDGIVTALAAGSGQKLAWHKVMAQASIANIPASLWNATGIPIAGTYGSVGKANGRTCNGSTVGALAHGNAGGGTTQHLIGADAYTATASTIGTLILVDRLADCLLAHAEATGSITGLSGTGRLASGEGGQIWCEVQTQLSAGSNTITYTYTNQAGTGSQVTQSVVTTASAVVGRSVNANLWQPLASGDRGVRSIESVTLSAGSATGQYALCIVRPLLYLPMPVVAVASSRDCVMELPNLPKIYDNSCLQWIWMGAAVTATMGGEVRLAYG